MENKDGSITHYVDLQVQMCGIHRNMRFLITNIRNEDIVLGYPWLALYEPKFSWKHATIDKAILLIVLRSVNPQIPHKSIIAHTNREKEEIIQTLESDCTIRTTATKLAIQAQQYTTKTEVPKEYTDFTKVFSEEESKRYPPKRA